MEYAGRLAVLRECGGAMMWRMVRLLLGGNTSLPMYGSVAWAAGGGGSAETKMLGVSGGKKKDFCGSRSAKDVGKLSVVSGGGREVGIRDSGVVVHGGWRGARGDCKMLHYGRKQKKGRQGVYGVAGGSGGGAAGVSGSD